MPQKLLFIIQTFNISVVGHFSDCGCVHARTRIGNLNKKLGITQQVVELLDRTLVPVCQAVCGALKVHFGRVAGTRRVTLVIVSERDGVVFSATEETQKTLIRISLSV